ncbi:Kinase-like protein [Pleurotus pulmonarius]
MPYIARAATYGHFKCIVELLFFLVQILSLDKTRPRWMGCLTGIGLCLAKWVHCSCTSQLLATTPIPRMRRLLANSDTDESATPASDITGLIKITRNEVRRGVMAGVSLGTIRRGRFKKEKVAVKIFDGGPGTPGSYFAASMKKMLEQSSSIWSRVDHPNLVPFYGVAFGLAYMPAIVYPFYSNGNILAYLAQRYPGEVDPENSERSATILVLMVEVAKGLEYLHTFDPPIIHGDVRGASIFISDDGHAMLCDYGLTLSTPEELPDHIYSRPVGVARWMAPEIMGTIAHEDVYGPPTGRTKQTDIYAYGMTILEVYTGLPPFGQLVTDEKGTHPLVRVDDGAVKIVLEGGRPPLSGIPQSNETLRALVERAWDASPENRPDAAEIVRILEPMVPDAPEGARLAATSDSPSGSRASGKVYGVVHYLVFNPWGHIRTLVKSGYDSLRRSLH